uniref:Uncharacterized protein n=1 Tax=Panagrolaimus sp. PS1159 TaxID=55785 RepID=A0AC35FSR9_9BILA
MSFVEPLDEPINPYTGYPFRKENLDERIRRILEDDDDDDNDASFVQTNAEQIDTVSSNRFVASAKQNSVLPSGKDIRKQYYLIPSIPVKTCYNVNSSNRFRNYVKQDPRLPGSSTNVKYESQIIPPPNKRIKLEYKHSFNFIDDNSSIDERKQHQSIFRHMDDSMKKEEINKAYQEVTEIIEILWPNPRKVTKDVKVTALNVNEFIKDDVLQIMLDAALNNPNLFEAHELSLCKETLM